MASKMFCENQIYAKGNSRKAYSCSKTDPKAQLFCCAHLNEAHAFPCPYKPEEIYLEESRPRIAHKSKEGELECVCEDFSPAKTFNQKSKILAC